MRKTALLPDLRDQGVRLLDRRSLFSGRRIKESDPLIWICLFVALAACGGGGGSNSGTGPNNPPPPPPPPPGSILIALGPPTLTIPQGGQVQLAVTVAKTNFTGAVTVALAGTPAGVTSTISQPQGSGVVATGTIILVAAATTAPGTYTLTATASGTGVANATASVSLTITAVGTYNITGTTGGVTAGPGGSAIALLGIQRNNFAAPITLVADSLPPGVTASFSINPVVFDASSVTVSVAATVALGTYRLSIRGTAAGFPDRSVPLVLTVASLGGFTLSATPSPASLAQGTSRAVTLTVNRIGNFSGIVLLQVEGAPAGLTVALNPTATQTTSILNLTAGAGLAAGNYNLTIRGQASGVPEQTVALQVQVTPATGGSGNVTLDFSACVGLNVPAWVAYQDGNGAWTRATATGNVYRFTISAATGGFAYVIPGPTTNTSQVNVQYMSRNELSAAPFIYCSGAGPVLKIVTGSVTGLSGGDIANISLGGGLSFANPSIPTFSIASVQNGSHDLIVWRHDLLGDITGAGNPDRGFIRRDQNIANNGSLGALDMNGSESFGPASAVFTVNGMLAGDEVSHTMRYNTGSACLGAMLYSSVRLTGNTFTGFGFPAALQRPSDYHQLTFTSTTRQSGVLFPTGQRTLIETFQTMGARNLTLGAVLAAPTITTLPGNYKRLQASFTLAAEYNALATLSYTSVSKVVTISATPAWIGGASVTLSLPSFTGISGWNDVWPPASGATGQWTASVSGSGTNPSLCSNNARFVTAMRAGSF